MMQRDVCSWCRWMGRQTSEGEIAVPYISPDWSFSVVFSIVSFSLCGRAPVFIY